MTKRLMMLIVLISLLTSAFALAAQDAPVVTTADQLTVEVISTRPHDPNAYTQGLLLHDGWLYESTGRYGQSNLRQVDPETGVVRRQVDLPHYLFGEGLALVDDRLIQITWQEQIALVYDLQSFQQDTLAQASLLSYTGQGWGLCFDDNAIYMTDGSSNLYQRDADTFEVLETIPVTLDGQPLDRLNELECVGDAVYANVYQTNDIVRIDKATGTVTARIDASGLLDEAETAALGTQPYSLSVLIFNGQQQNFTVKQVNEGGFVLNGIAYDAENDTFLITGKMWPKLFEVRFVPAGE